MKKLAVVSIVLFFCLCSWCTAQEANQPVQKTEESAAQPTPPAQAAAPAKEYLPVYDGFKFSYPKELKDEKFQEYIAGLKKRIAEKTTSCSGEAYFEFKSKVKPQYFVFNLNLWKGISPNPTVFRASTYDETSEDFQVKTAATLKKVYEAIFAHCGCAEKSAE